MNKWEKYQIKTKDKPVNPLLKNFLEENKMTSAIDLGCGSGSDAAYMANTGIKVLGIDHLLNKEMIHGKVQKDKRANLTLQESKFEEVTLPKTDLVVAFLSIPFCKPYKVAKLMNKIEEAIKENGYFVGSLFGKDDGFSKIKSIKTFSKEEVLAYFKNYQICHLEEVKYEEEDKMWHFYEIIAKKRK